MLSVMGLFAGELLPRTLPFKTGNAAESPLGVFSVRDRIKRVSFDRGGKR
jgi:hypothetical protein